MHKYILCGILIALVLAIYFSATEQKEMPITLNPYIQGMTVAELPSIKYVHVGSSPMIIDENDDLWVWGENIGYPIYQDSKYSDEYFYNPIWKASNVKSAQSFASSCLMLKNDRTLWTFGGNVYRLGQGSRSSWGVEPKKILEGVLQFDMGSWNAVAVKDDGSLWSWGFQGTRTEHRRLEEDNESWEIYENYSFHSPQKIMDDVVYAATGYGTYYVIKIDGSLWAWGSNNHAQLADGTTEDRSIEDMWMIMEDVAEIQATHTGATALKNDGSLWSWGNNYYYYIGVERKLGENNIVTTPQKVLENVYSYSVTYDSGAAILDNGSLWIWGGTPLRETEEAPRIHWSEYDVLSVPREVMQGVVSASSDGAKTLVLKDDGSLMFASSSGQQEYNDEIARPLVYGVILP